MSEIDLWQKAEENVAKRASPPAYEPMNAGLAGLTITGGVLTLFMVFARIDTDDFAGAFAITSAIGFGAPYLYYRSERSRYSAKISAEYHYLANRTTS